jgi:hypothetical protein
VVPGRPVSARLVSYAQLLRSQQNVPVVQAASAPLRHVILQAGDIYCTDGCRRLPPVVVRAERVDPATR